MTDAKPPIPPPHLPSPQARDAVLRAQARRQTATEPSGGRNVLIGVGIALIATMVVLAGLRAMKPNPPASAPASTQPSSRAQPIESAPSVAPTGSTSRTTGGDAATPYVDPATSPQSGYALDPEGLTKHTGMPHLDVLHEPTARLVAERVFAKTGIRLIQFTAPARFGQQGCTDSADSDISRHAQLVETEFTLYPQKFLAGTGVAFVALCRDVVDVDKRRSAIAAPAVGVLVLDTADFRTEEFFRATFHHELFHMIDGHDQLGNSDPEWGKLNPAGFEYGGGKTARDASSPIGSGGKGFVTEYARVSLEEDKAETFRTLLLDNRGVERLAANDSILNSKVRLVQKRLLAHSNAIDSGFWSAVH